MPLQIDPVNLQGLSQLAGRGQGALNISVPGELGLKSLALSQNQQQAAQQAALEQMRIRAQEDASLRAAGLDRARMAQQQQQFQQQLKADQAKQQSLLGMQQNAQALDAAQSNRTFGLQERQQSFAEEQAKRQEAALKLKEETLALASKKKEDINNMGAFATQARLAMDKVGDPLAAKTMQKEIISDAVKQGYLSDEEGNNLNKMPISGFKNALDFKILQLNHVKEYQAMKKAGGDNGSSTQVYDPATGNLVYSSKLTTPNETKFQGDLVEANDSLKQMEPYLKPPRDYFGVASLQHSTYEKGKEMTVGANPKEKEQLGKYTEFNANAKLMLMKTAKAMAGSKFSDTDLATITEIMPTVGFGQTQPEYEAKAKLVKDYLNMLKSSREKLLSQNLKIGTPEYDDAMSAEIQKNAQVVTSPAFQYYRDKHPDWSEDKLRRAMAKAGVQ